jgi:hypothetical protein
VRKFDLAANDTFPRAQTSRVRARSRRLGGLY